MQPPDPTPTSTPYGPVEDWVQRRILESVLIPNISAFDLTLILFAGVAGGILGFFLKVNGDIEEMSCKKSFYLLFRQVLFGVIWAMAAFIIMTSLGSENKVAIGVGFFIVFVGSLSGDTLMRMFNQWLQKKLRKQTEKIDEELGKE